MNIRYAIENNLRGKDWIDALGLSPEIVKNRQHHCTTCALNELAPNVIQLVNSWPIENELRFVGAI